MSGTSAQTRYLVVIVQRLASRWQWSTGAAVRGGTDCYQSAGVSVSPYRMTGRESIEYCGMSCSELGHDQSKLKCSLSLALSLIPFFSPSLFNTKGLWRVKRVRDYYKGWKPSNSYSNLRSTLSIFSHSFIVLLLCWEPVSHIKVGLSEGPGSTLGPMKRGARSGPVVWTLWATGKSFVWA